MKRPHVTRWRPTAADAAAGGGARRPGESSRSVRRSPSADRLPRLRAHAPAFRVRPNRASRADHQDGIAAGALAIQEGIARYKGDTKLRADFHRIAERRGKHKARIAVARKLLTLVYGLRDGEIRALAKAA
jgi:hypothetical protein